MTHTNIHLSGDNSGLKVSNEPFPAGNNIEAFDLVRLENGKGATVCFFVEEGRGEALAVALQEAIR